MTILDHLWQSTLVAVVIAILTLVFRNNSASVRYWLWFAASLKFLQPFSLLAQIGRKAGGFRPSSSAFFAVLSPPSFLDLPAPPARP